MNEQIDTAKGTTYVKSDKNRWLRLSQDGSVLAEATEREAELLDIIVADRRDLARVNCLYEDHLRMERERRPQRYGLPEEM